MRQFIHLNLSRSMKESYLTIFNDRLYDYEGKMGPANIKINPLGGAVLICTLLLIFFYVFGFPSIFSGPEERVSMKELLTASVILARRGGEHVRSVRRSDTLQQEAKGKTKEGAIELKSKGDMESHKAIYYGFAKAFPGLTVISEEHEKHPVDFASIPDIAKKMPEIEELVTSDQSIPKKDITVWIDPLDATQEYTEEKDKDGSDMLHYVTTMVCVAVNGQPRIGVIHKPFINEDRGGETVWSWINYGHSSNLQKSEKKKKGENDPHKIIVSRSHAGDVQKVAEKSLGTDVKITPAGGAGYKTLEVIKGKQDAYIHSTAIKKWDICAGNAVLSSLDGKMTSLDGNYIDFSSTGSAKLEGGLLATLYDHEQYLEKLEEVKKSSSH